ncbi:MAG: glycosyltransferase family 4 protein [Myxococcota bacterium]
MADDARLQIAHVTGERGFSGGEVQVFLLMDELGRRGHRNVLVCPPGSESESAARARGIGTIAVPMRSSLSPLAVARTRRALARIAPDLVHLHTGRANWAGAPAARLLGLPAVTTRRMDRPVARGPRTRWLYGRGVRHAVAISQAVRDCLLAGGVAAERVSVVPSAVDPASLRSRRPRAEIRAELGAQGGECCVLVLARLTRRKGVDLLLDAVARQQQPVALWIAGDGPERPALEERCARLGLASVRFLGRRDDKGDLLLACDVFAMPSRAEGLGVAALEAMACERPVVASDVGGLSELVDDTTGLRVAAEDVDGLRDALDRLAGDTALRHRLGAAGPARVARGHLPEQMADAYEAIYRDVLAGRLG